MRVIHWVNARSRLKLGSNVRQLLVCFNVIHVFVNHIASDGATSGICEDGFETDYDPSIGLVQLGLEVESRNVSAIYYSILNKLSLIANDATVTQDSLGSRRVTCSFGLSGSWAQEQCSLLSTICDGWGPNSIVTAAVVRWVEVRPELRDWNGTICFCAPTTPAQL